MRIIHGADADIVALQNISSLPSGTGLSTLAAQSAYPFFVQGKTGTLGLLARIPLKFIQTYALGDGAFCMKADLVHHDKRFILLNISLNGPFFKRPVQIRNLLGPDLLEPDSLALPTLLLGDFYDLVWISGHYRFNHQLRRFAPRWLRATYPARLPIVSRDRVYARGGISLQHIEVDHSKSARNATAHLPSIFTIQITDTRVAIAQQERVVTPQLKAVTG